MSSLSLAVIALLLVFGASMLIERLLQKSRKEMRNPGWLLVFLALLAPGIAVVYAQVPVDSPLLYAAYALAGGAAALVAQCCFGAKLSRP